MVVISYQMGKVASSAIANSIPGCYQIHSLNGEEPIKYFSSRYTGSLKGRIFQFFKWKMLSNKIKKIIRLRKDKKIKILVGVREPVSRSVSGFFQTLTHREKGIDICRCVDDYWAFSSHFSSLKWFDLEIKRELGLDVYDYPFDVEKGFSVINHDGIEFFIYQQERLAELESSLGEFLGLEGFELSKSNSAEDKWLSGLYSEFSHNVKFPKSYLDVMYESKYYLHFYGRTNIHYQKWISSE